MNKVTPILPEFFLYPSSGTLRDSTFNIIFYDSHFDTCRWFRPDRLQKSEE